MDATTMKAVRIHKQGDSSELQEIGTLGEAVLVRVIIGKEFPLSEANTILRHINF